MIRIGIAGVNPFDGNRGVGALSYSIVHILQQLSEKEGKEYELYFILNGSTMPRTCTIEVGEKQYEIKILHLVSVYTIKHFVKLLIYFKDFLTYCRLDYVLDASYGDSYSDIYGKANFRSHNSIKRFFSLIGKKQMLLPQTVGPFFAPDVKKSAVRTMNRMQVLLARDRMSYEFLQENVRRPKSVEIIDLAFFMPFKKDSLLRKEGEFHIGLGISKMLWNKGLQATMSYKDDYSALMRQIIQRFLSMGNVYVHLVPHVVCENNSKGNDYELCYRIWQEYHSDRLILSPFFLDPIKAKNYISSLDFFAGSRMHACIASFSSGVPVYPISYSRKFIGLFNETLSYSYVGDLTTMQNEDIMAGLFDAFDNRTVIASEIADKMKGIVAERKQVLDKELLAFLNS